MKTSAKIKKGDIAVLAAAAAALICVLVLRGGAGDKVTARISVNGETVCVIELDEVASKREIELENGVVIGVEPGKIYFVSSFCGGKDCVKFGELSRAGQSAACVPAKTAITLSGGGDKGSPDAISF